MNATAPYWVKLVRSGSTFSASASPDGENWTDLGSITISMTNQIYVGLALSAHNDGVMNRSTFDNVTLSSPTASQLLVTQPTTTTAGSPFELDVSALDQFGNASTSFDGIVTIGLKSNPGGDILGGSQSVQATGGTAHFTGLTLDTAGSGYTIEAMSTGLDSVTTGTFDILPAAPMTLVLMNQPAGNITAGSLFDLKLVAEDQFRNIATQFTGSVTVALTTNTGNTLFGTLSVKASAGVADFSNLAIDKVAQGYSIQATSAGLSVTTGSFNIVPAAPSILIIRNQPTTNVIAGMPFDVALVAQDQFGNLASQFTGSIRVSLTSNTARTLLGTQSKVATLGMADFSDLTLDTAATGYVVQAASAGLRARPQHPSMWCRQQSRSWS